MIVIENINAINKGTLLATCQVRIIPWKIILHDIKIFQKGTNRWINMPAKEVVIEHGEKKYVELITFDSEAVKNRFRAQIMGAVDEFLKLNPDMKPQDVIVEEEMPF